MKQCPRCELNYMKDDAEACSVCLPPETPNKVRRNGRTTSVLKPKAEGNVAFKCNYCDGGKSETEFGYAGICSIENIKRNIEIGRRWCNDSECVCTKYSKGQITHEQLMALQGACSESRMLLDWKADAGEDRKPGERRGRRRMMSKTLRNSLCVLTTCMPGSSETGRVIFAVFIADKASEGVETQESGWVQCTTDLKIKLTQKEAKRLLFWNYYFNPENPERVQFGSGLYRYLDDMQAAQILRDIATVKAGTSDDQKAKDLFAQFCEIKKLDSALIPENKGALTR